MQNVAFRAHRQVTKLCCCLIMQIFLFQWLRNRLLSWAGKRIEPYGVEYILHKLGFSQARTTIPKWVQRGAMDPLDKILSLVLSRTIAAQRANESNNQAKR